MLQIISSQASSEKIKTTWSRCSARHVWKASKHPFYHVSYLLKARASSTLRVLTQIWTLINLRIQKHICSWLLSKQKFNYQVREVWPNVFFIESSPLTHVNVKATIKNLMPESASGKMPRQFDSFTNALTQQDFLILKWVPLEIVLLSGPYLTIVLLSSHILTYKLSQHAMPCSLLIPTKCDEWKLSFQNDTELKTKTWTKSQNKPSQRDNFTIFSRCG